MKVMMVVDGKSTQSKSRKVTLLVMRPKPMMQNLTTQVETTAQVNAVHQLEASVRVQSKVEALKFTKSVLAN